MLNSLPLEKMIWIDYTIAVMILASAVIGLFRGFVREAFALTTWLAAIWVGLHYSHDLSPLLQPSIGHTPAQLAIAFVGLFILTLLLGGMITFILQHLIEKTGLTGSDRLLGMLFGLLRGAVLIAVMVMLAGMTSAPLEPWWQQSQLLPPFLAFAIWLKSHIPAELAGYFNFR